jgi:hypothetical protein
MIVKSEMGSLSSSGAFRPKNRLESGETTWQCAISRSGVVAGEKWSRRRSSGSSIEPRVPAHANNHLESNRIKDL